MSIREHVSQPVTISFLKFWLPVCIMILMTGVAWGTVIGSIDLANQKIDTLTQANNNAVSRLGLVESNQKADEINIAKLQQVIQDAQQRGLLSRVTDPSNNIAAALPIPIPTPDLQQKQPQQTITYNTTIQPQPTNTPYTFPTPQPTPTPTVLHGVTPSFDTVLSVLGI